MPPQTFIRAPCSNFQPPIDALMTLSSAGDADQMALMYCGLGFLEALTGLAVNAGAGGGPVIDNPPSASGAGTRFVCIEVA